MSDGAEESSSGLFASPSTDPSSGSSTGALAAEPGPEVSAAAGGSEDNRALGLAGLAATCCICMETEQLRSCLHSEKICILPILACLISLALCTAGLKWVFVDKIFEYEPPTHLDPKRIGQDPVLIADPTLGLTWEPPHTSSHPTSSVGEPDVYVKSDPSVEPFNPSPSVTQSSPTSALTLVTTSLSSGPLSTPKPEKKEPHTPRSKPTVESTVINVPKFWSTSTPPAGKTSHVTPCSDSKKNYCVNGGECYTLDAIPGNTKYLCRCPNEFTGDRCQNYVMPNFYKHLGIGFMEAEELYQKRILTITGICIALLVVGIMCVVAYCKTKKQRKMLHDRLRQSLRSERNNMASLGNGPQNSNPPTENLQLVNQYTSKNAIPTELVTEKETETSFSTSQYTSTTHHSATVTRISSQNWSNGPSESLISESQSVVVTSSVETSRNTTPLGHRGRLNATRSARDLNAYIKSSRDTPDSYKDSPHSERYVSAMTTPNRMSPVDLHNLTSPKSPPSEVSQPMSSLATSVPSVAISPLGEEERPLLLVTPPRMRDKHQEHPSSQYQRNSAHYNHAHEAHSPPPSPLRIVEDDEYETTPEYEPAAPQPTKKLANGRRAKRTKLNGHVPHKLESDSDTSSESSSSESETEDERVGEDTPFLSIQNPLAGDLELGPALRPADGSRTNTNHKLAAQEDLQVRLSSVIANQDPIAV
ncbi:pro-neuregulin-1, membrane-bound isoform isoform X5 [Lepisosteus oculatus]|uniref:pro-neuregulin-1, membrane-bound isoform isoform X5 n=1 Tax=Lepisosteus oculatus TaxID=7918 RepID=UPI0037133D87